MTSQKTPGVNYSNIFREDFIREDPKRAKNTVKLLVFFALLGSVSIKAACKMLVKSTPEIKSNVSASIEFNINL